MYCIENGQIKLKSQQAQMFHDTKVSSLKFSQDGSVLASGDINGEIRVWKMSNGKCLRKLSCGGDAGPVHSILIT